MPNHAHRQLIARVLRMPDSTARYATRCHAYPRLGLLVPERVEDVENDKEPWFCHGLGWRLATWGSDVAFARLESLLALAESVPGWGHEWRANWAGERLADFERFFHLLWMLQCGEFFLQENANVSFSSCRRHARLRT